MRLRTDIQDPISLSLFLRKKEYPSRATSCHKSCSMVSQYSINYTYLVLLFVFLGESQNYFIIHTLCFGVEVSEVINITVTQLPAPPSNHKNSEHFLFRVATFFVTFVAPYF